MNLPAPAEVDVPSIVKSYILGLPTKGPLDRDPSGRAVVSFGVSDRSLITEASFASKPIIKLAGETLGTLEWTEEEVKQLYLKARELWPSYKVALKIMQRGPFGVSGSLKAAIGELGQFLARATLPKMKWADDTIWQELLTWLQEGRGVAVFPSVALPYVLIHRPAEADSIGRTIAEDIDTDDDDRVAAAGKAIRHWVHLGAMGQTPKPPSTLLTALIERIIFRRKSGINPCLWHLSCLIAEKQEAITPSDAALLSASLLPWHHATILPIPEEGAGDFREAERPDVRVRIANLAGALRIWYINNPSVTPEPSAIEKWKEWCASDPLPEIQRAFDFREEVAP